MDKTKKRNLRRYILWGVMALVVVWLAAMPLLARQKQQETGPVASILEAQAKMGSVTTAIHGGGTLEAEDAEDVEIPAEVKITRFLVKNGDEVKKGDPVAQIDKVSALTAITQIRDSMFVVQRQLESYSDEKAPTTVTAPAGGRVKAVYARAGDSVSQVLLEHGGLALLSLDGQMAVTISAQSQLIPGDTVPVTLDTGKTVTGRVETNLAGELTVTIEDKGYREGQTVTVGDLGSGELEIHSPWLATAFNGTIDAVRVKAEQNLSSGATLFTLKNTDYTAQRTLLAEKHRDYEELLTRLMGWYDTGLITAPCDGLVSGIDTDSTHLLAAEDEEVTASLLNADGGEFRLVLLSAVVMDEGDTTITCTKNASCTLPNGSDDHDPACPHACKTSSKEGECKANSHFARCIENCTKQRGCTAQVHKDGCLEKCTGDAKCPVLDLDKHNTGCPMKCIESDGSTTCTAKIHKNTCIGACTHADTGANCPATAHHYADCIKDCANSQNADTLCPASKHQGSCYFNGATYTAKVFKVINANGTLMRVWDPNTYVVEQTASGWKLKGKDVNQCTFINAEGLPPALSGTYMDGDVVLAVTATKDEKSTSFGLHRASSGSGGMPNIDLGGLMKGMGGFTMPAMGGMSGTTTQTQLYSLDGDVLMTVTPMERFTVTIAVDEQDISDVHASMTAELTMNALPGETFEGEITRVAQTGSGNGGSSKFAVEITLSRESGMLPGMSATAVVPLYEKMDVLTLPAAALEDDGGRILVYTAKNKKTGEPANPVEVTIGISDGDNVEILSGIDSGTTVYYRYYDVVEESDAVELDKVNMF